ARGLSWAQLTREVNRSRRQGHPIASSTLTGLATKSVAEGDGVLQMLVWLDRTPESFVPGLPDPDGAAFRLARVAAAQLLRWDKEAVYAGLDGGRAARGMTWSAVAREIGGFTPAQLGSMNKGSRVGFPGVMRIVRWLGQPAASFTRIVDARMPT